MVEVSAQKKIWVMIKIMVIPPPNDRKVSKIDELANFTFKKSDAQVGRVNTFHTLQTIRKGPLNFKLCM
jgi:hypothetical protein